MPSKIIIEYSDNIPDVLHETKEEFEKEAKMALAVKLFEMKRISSGVAASLVGIDRVSFLLNLSQYRVSMINLTEEDLMLDINNA